MCNGLFCKPISQMLPLIKRRRCRASKMPHGDPS
jgi:hypothetical protein